MTTTNTTINDLTSKPGLQGTWYLAYVTHNGKEYMVRAVSHEGMISVFECKSLTTGREANYGGSVRRTIEVAMRDAVGAKITAREINTDDIVFS